MGRRRGEDMSIEINEMGSVVGRSGNRSNRRRRNRRAGRLRRASTRTQNLVHWWRWQRRRISWRHSTSQRWTNQILARCSCVELCDRRDLRGRRPRVKRSKDPIWNQEGTDHFGLRVKLLFPDIYSLSTEEGKIAYIGLFINRRKPRTEEAEGGRHKG